MPFHWLFPTPVLQVDLKPDGAIAEAMDSELEAFDRQVYQHPEFSDRNNLTGDLLGHAGLDQLHRMEAFQWLNQQLALGTATYLEELLGSDHGLEVHIQKAWPVVCANDGGTIETHTHRNAQLSAVFYVRTEPGNDSGELEFQAPDDYFSHIMAIPYQDAAASGGVRSAEAPFASVSLRSASPRDALSRTVIALFGFLRPGHHNALRTGQGNAHAPPIGLGAPCAGGDDLMPPCYPIVSVGCAFVVRKSNHHVAKASPDTPPALG